LEREEKRKDRRQSYSALVAVLVHRAEESTVDESGDESG